MCSRPSSSRLPSGKPRQRNLIERFFSKLNHFRRVATRYDNLAANFLTMIQLASMRLWLRAYESTAQLNNARVRLYVLYIETTFKLT